MDGDDVLLRMDAADLPDLYDPTAPGADQLASVLSDLRAPARPEELDRTDVVMAAFSARTAAMAEAAKEKTLAKEKGAPKREPHRRDNVIHLPRHLGPKLGVATAVALIGLTGVAAAAVTGSLPAPLQSFVHSKIGAIAGPSTHPAASTGASAAEPSKSSAAKPATVSPSTAPSPAPRVGPFVTGPAAAGLCRSFAAHGNGGSGSTGWPKSTAERNLAAAAAAAAESVDAYCAPYLENGSSSGKSSSSSGPNGSANGQPGHGKHATPAPQTTSSTGTGSGSSGSSNGNSGGSSGHGL